MNLSDRVLSEHTVLSIKNTCVPPAELSTILPIVPRMPYISCMGGERDTTDPNRKIFTLYSDSHA